MLEAEGGESTAKSNCITLPIARSPRSRYALPDTPACAAPKPIKYGPTTK
jgi:hypothetical protein